jgi:hypothetical protein
MTEMNPPPDDPPEPIPRWAPWRWKLKDQIGLAFVLIVFGLLAQGCAEELIWNRMR